MWRDTDGPQKAAPLPWLLHHCVVEMCKLELQLKPLGSMVHPYTFCHSTAYENKLPFLLYLAVYHSRPCLGVVALLLQLPQQKQLLQICIRNTVIYYFFAIAIRFKWKLKPSTTPAQRNLIVTTLGFLEVIRNNGVFEFATTWCQGIFTPWAFPASWK